MIANRQQAIAAIKSWWDKHQVLLQGIEAERDTAAKQLDEFLKGLVYV